MENVHVLQRNTDLGAEARAWVLKFNADVPPTQDDIRALREWSSRSAAHRAELKKAEDFWCEADLLTELAVPLHRSENDDKPGFFRGLLTPFTAMELSGGLAMAASLLVVFAVSFLMISTPGPVTTENYMTVVGEQQVITMSDDSRIQLDTNSQLRVTYSDNAREIQLLQGKAHFDVAKDADRPFEVYAGDGVVRAVGTAFSVFLAGQDIHVTVDEGRVDLARVAASQSFGQSSTKAINQGDTQYRAKHGASSNVFRSLDAGQSMIFNSDYELFTQLEENDLARELAWKRGLLVFAGVPLREVVSEVSRYTTAHIEIHDPELNKLEVGGRFKVGELDAFLDALEIQFGLQVSYINKEHIQLRSSSP